MHSIDTVIAKLNLSENRKEQIKLFIETVSVYKLLPYISFISNNPEIANKINQKTNGKDNWDAVVFLYRYNIKLSKAIYPYIYVLETALKTKINNVLCQHFGNDWYRNPEISNRVNTSSIDFLKKKREDYLKQRRNHNGIDFIENHTTFGVLVSFIESGNLWNSKDIQIRKLFSAKETINTMLLSHNEISKKIRSINDLRNAISHYNRILGCKVDRKGYSDFRIGDVYQNILYILTLLGFENINWTIGDLDCCSRGSFEALYKEYEFIHGYDIRVDKPQKEKVSL
jgi:hypothetical protein